MEGLGTQLGAEGRDCEGTGGHGPDAVLEFKVRRRGARGKDDRVGARLASHEGAIGLEGVDEINGDGLRWGEGGGSEIGNSTDDREGRERLGTSVNRGLSNTERSVGTELVDYPPGIVSWVG